MKKTLLITLLLSLFLTIQAQTYRAVTNQSIELRVDSICPETRIISGNDSILVFEVDIKSFHKIVGISKPELRVILQYREGIEVLAQWFMTDLIYNNNIDFQGIRYTAIIFKDRRTLYSSGIQHIK